MITSVTTFTLPTRDCELCSFHGSCVLHHCIISTVAANLASIISLLRLKSCNCICHNIYSSHPGSQNTSTVGDLLSSSRSPAAEHNRWTVKTLRMGEVRVGAFIPLYQHKLFLLFVISCGEARRWEIKVFALKLNLSQSWHPSDSWSTLKVRNKQDQQQTVEMEIIWCCQLLAWIFDGSFYLNTIFAWFALL